MLCNLNKIQIFIFNLEVGRYEGYITWINVVQFVKNSQEITKLRNRVQNNKIKDEKYVRIP